MKKFNFKLLMWVWLCCKTIALEMKAINFLESIKINCKRITCCHSSSFCFFYIFSLSNFNWKPNNDSMGTDRSELNARARGTSFAGLSITMGWKKIVWKESPRRSVWLRSMHDWRRNLFMGDLGYWNTKKTFASSFGASFTAFERGKISLRDFETGGERERVSNSKSQIRIFEKNKSKKLNSFGHRNLVN